MLRAEAPVEAVLREVVPVEAVLRVLVELLCVRAEATSWLRVPAELTERVVTACERVVAVPAETAALLVAWLRTEATA